MREIFTGVSSIFFFVTYGCGKHSVLIETSDGALFILALSTLYLTLKCRTLIKLHKKNDVSPIPGGPKKPRNSRFRRFFRTLLWSTIIFFTLLDKAHFPHYINTKIIKFVWELFILWVISYGLSFSEFARFPEFQGTINDKSMVNPENDSP